MSKLVSLSVLLIGLCFSVSAQASAEKSKLPSHTKFSDDEILDEATRDSNESESQTDEERSAQTLKESAEKISNEIEILEKQKDEKEATDAATAAKFAKEYPELYEKMVARRSEQEKKLKELAEEKKKVEEEAKKAEEAVQKKEEEAKKLVKTGLKNIDGTIGYDSINRKLTKLDKNGFKSYVSGADEEKIRNLLRENSDNPIFLKEFSKVIIKGKNTEEEKKQLISQIKSGLEKEKNVQDSVAKLGLSIGKDGIVSKSPLTAENLVGLKKILEEAKVNSNVKSGVERAFFAKFDEFSKIKSNENIFAPNISKLLNDYVASEEKKTVPEPSVTQTAPAAIAVLSPEQQISKMLENKLIVNKWRSQTGVVLTKSTDEHGHDLPKAALDYLNKHGNVPYFDDQENPTSTNSRIYFNPETNAHLGSTGLSPGAKEIRKDTAASTQAQTTVAKDVTADTLNAVFENSGFHFDKKNDGVLTYCGPNAMDKCQIVADGKTPITIENFKRAATNQSVLTNLTNLMRQKSRTFISKGLHNILQKHVQKNTPIMAGLPSYSYTPPVNSTDSVQRVVPQQQPQTQPEPRKFWCGKCNGGRGGWIYY